MLPFARLDIFNIECFDIHRVERMVTTYLSMVQSSSRCDRDILQSLEYHVGEEDDFTLSTEINVAGRWRGNPYNKTGAK